MASKHSIHCLLAGLSVALLIVSLCSCAGEESRVVVTDFPHEYKLQATGIDSMNRYPGVYAISMAGDRIIALRKANKFYLVLDSDFHLLNEIAPRGHGRGEFVFPSYCGQCENDGEAEYIYVLERTESKLYRVSLAGEKDSECVVNIPQNLGLTPSFLFKVDDHTCAGTNGTGAFPFFVLDTKDWKAQSFEPTLPLEGNEAELFVLSQNIGTYSAAQSRIALAYFCFPQLDIRQSDGQLLRTVVYKRELSSSEINVENPMGYFDCVASTSRHIYALYNGEEDKPSVNKTWIFVFNWDGDPVSRMEVDACSYFTVDEAKGRIIALNEDDTRFVASEYKLPDALLAE